MTTKHVIKLGKWYLTESISKPMVYRWDLYRSNATVYYNHSKERMQEELAHAPPTYTSCATCIPRVVKLVAKKTPKKEAMGKSGEGSYAVIKLRDGRFLARWNGKVPRLTYAAHFPCEDAANTYISALSHISNSDVREWLSGAVIERYGVLSGRKLGKEEP